MICSPLPIYFILVLVVLVSVSSTSATPDDIKCQTCGDVEECKTPHDDVCGDRKGHLCMTRSDASGIFKMGCVSSKDKRDGHCVDIEPKDKMTRECYCNKDLCIAKESGAFGVLTKPTSWTNLLLMTLVCFSSSFVIVKELV